MANTLFNFIEVKYSELTNQVNTWLQGIFNKSNSTFSPASPQGQLINLQKELFEHNIIYLKNAANQINIEESTNDKVIKNIATIAGVQVGRAISATGTLGFKLKTGIDIQKEIKDSVLIINDNTVIRNKTNNLDYTIKIGTIKNTYPISKGSQFFVPIIQGKFETQTFTGKGTANQSIRVNVPSTASIENFNFTVTYNGTPLAKRNHLYEMLPNEFACYTKTGFNGGLDVFFGDGSFGFMPLNASIIQVTYLLSAGSQGEVLNPVVNDWRFIGDVTDGQGNPVKMDKLFDIWVETPINFSADAPDAKSLKTIIPYVSRNFVLATPDQFIYHLSRLNMFSKVNAFNKLDDNVFSVSDTVVENSIKKLSSSINQNDSRAQINNNLNNFLKLYSQYKTNLNDNEIYLYLIPDIRKYLGEYDYFSLPFDVFYLDDDEKNKVLQYLRSIGTVSQTVNIKILQPQIIKFVMMIYVSRYSNTLEDNIKQEIISQVSNYFLTSNRFDVIPNADIIALIKSIPGIDSATVVFISEENEKYHQKAISLGYSNTPSIYAKDQQAGTRNQTILSTPMVKKNGILVNQAAYNPKLTINLDPIFNNIVMGKNQYALIRGGWSNRQGVYFYENPNQNGLSSINIQFTNVIQK